VDRRRPDDGDHAWEGLAFSFSRLPHTLASTAPLYRGLFPTFCNRTRGGQVLWWHHGIMK
jgi:hypothetical protein